MQELKWREGEEGEERGRETDGEKRGQVMETVEYRIQMAQSEGVLQSNKEAREDSGMGVKVSWWCWDKRWRRKKKKNKVKQIVWEKLFLLVYFPLFNEARY